MGASEYMDIGQGRTAQEAFNRLVTAAQWEHGHGGYSGTIAEKQDFVEFKRPKGMRRATVLAVARGLGRIMHDDDGNPQVNQSQTKYPQLPIAAMFKVWDDKWGPSLAIELSKGEYLFAGFASS